MEFETFNLGVQTPKLKGQIWIALGIILLVLGHSLYGLQGDTESIHHFISSDQHQDLNNKLKIKGPKPIIKFNMVLANY